MKIRRRREGIEKAKSVVGAIYVSGNKGNQESHNVVEILGDPFSRACGNTGVAWIVRIYGFGGCVGAGRPDDEVAGCSARTREETNSWMVEDRQCW